VWNRLWCKGTAGLRGRGPSFIGAGGGGGGARRCSLRCAPLTRRSSPAPAAGVPGGWLGAAPFFLVFFYRSFGGCFLMRARALAPMNWGRKAARCPGERGRARLRAGVEESRAPVVAVRRFGLGSPSARPAVVGVVVGVGVGVAGRRTKHNKEACFFSFVFCCLICPDIDEACPLSRPLGSREKVTQARAAAARGGRPLAGLGG
jgi:hypothetical protein